MTLICLNVVYRLSGPAASPIGVPLFTLGRRYLRTVLAVSRHG